MRKLIVLPALLSFLACLGSAPVVWATPSIPTCLISNGGAGGHFTKTLICVELLDQPLGHAGSGRYSPGDADTVHWLTETVEFRPPGSSVWVPLATAGIRGTGELKAVTRTVRLHAPGELRACTRAGTGADTQTNELCTIPN